MSEKKTQGAGAATVDSPGENTVEVTFLPEGKTVTFEHGKLPYKDHGKPKNRCSMWRLTSTFTSITPAAAIAPVQLATSG